MTKKALRPYLHLLNSNTSYDSSVGAIPLDTRKSKLLYVKLLTVKCDIIDIEDMCPNLDRRCGQLNITIEQAFQNQLCSKIEIKLREFNLKVLYDNENYSNGERKIMIYVIFVNVNK